MVVQLLYAIHGQGADAHATQFVEAGCADQRADQAAERDRQAVLLRFVVCAHLAAPDRAMPPHGGKGPTTHRDRSPDNVLVCVLARIVLAQAQVRLETPQDASESLRTQVLRVETPGNAGDNIESVSCKRAGGCRIPAEHAQIMGGGAFLGSLAAHAMQ